MRLHRFASDEHLVDRVRAGSAGAFEALFDRHHRSLLTFCRHMLGSATDAEDAVQHTFMAAYADLMRSDKPIELRPWLYTIARHRCLSMLRARRERPVAELPEPEIDHLAVAVDTREELRATLADIAHLPDDQRAALILAELGDASHAEIAQILGCRPEKVKALVFQARSSLATGRVARDTPCDEIREQLALGGLAIRRTFLRHHVRDCAGCREFGELMRVQRRRLRVLLPVAPSLGLKQAVLGSALTSAGGAATGMTAFVGALGVGGLAATAMVTVTVASGGGRGEPAPEAAPPQATITASAVRHERRATTHAELGLRTRDRAKPRPRTAPKRRRAGRAAKPVVVAHRTAPDAPAAHQPAVANSASEPPGHENRADPPGQERRPTPPGHEKRADPPAPPRGGKPDEPPGGGKPAEPPGGGKPPEPPGNPEPGPPEGRPEQPPTGPPPGAGDPSPPPPRR